MPSVKQTTAVDRLETREGTHDGVVLARDRAEADEIIRQRIANGTFDPRYGALVVPPDLILEEWEARHRKSPTD
jgi:hypothetical protein